MGQLLVLGLILSFDQLMQIGKHVANSDDQMVALHAADYLAENEGFMLLPWQIRSEGGKREGVFIVVLRKYDGTIKNVLERAKRARFVREARRYVQYSGGVTGDIGLFYGKVNYPYSVE